MGSLEGGYYVCVCVCSWFPVNLQGNQSLIFFGRPDAEAEAPILWPPDAKSLLIGKYPDAGWDWRWEEKGMTENEMVGCITDSMDMSLSKLWKLVMDREALCCSPWDCKESYTIEPHWITTSPEVRNLNVTKDSSLFHIYSSCSAWIQALTLFSHQSFLSYQTRSYPTSPVAWPILGILLTAFSNTLTPLQRAFPHLWMTCDFVRHSTFTGVQSEISCQFWHWPVVSKGWTQSFKRENK